MVSSGTALIDSTLADARAGSPAAFDRLLGPLLLPAFKLAMVSLRSREDAEDAVQEAATKAWRKLGQFRGEEPAFRAWFLSIVFNQCRMAKRTRWWSVLRMPELPPEHGGLAASTEEAAVTGADLSRALADLEPDERQALFLYFYLDLSIEEVGRVLGVSAGGAKSRIYRATRRMRPGLRTEEALL